MGRGLRVLYMECLLLGRMKLVGCWWDCDDDAVIWWRELLSCFGGLVNGVFARVVKNLGTD